MVGALSGGALIARKSGTVLAAADHHARRLLMRGSSRGGEVLGDRRRSPRQWSGCHRATSENPMNRSATARLLVAAVSVAGCVEAAGEDSPFLGSSVSNAGSAGVGAGGSGSAATGGGSHEGAIHSGGMLQLLDDKPVWDRAVRSSSPSAGMQRAAPLIVIDVATGPAWRSPTARSARRRILQRTGGRARSRGSSATTAAAGAAP